MRRLGSLAAVLAVSAYLLGCSVRAASPGDPVPAAAADPVARWIELLSVPYGQGNVLDTLAAELGGRLHWFLGYVVRDTTVPPIARANALLFLGERRAVDQISAFWFGLSAEEPMVRASAAVGLDGVLDAAERTAIGFLQLALEDPDRDVQARALETLADADVGLLRQYLARRPPADLEAIARNLVMVAEERGAPLEPVGDGSNGTAEPTLARQSAHGPRLEFRPTRAWPQWEAAVGELLVTPPGGAPVLLARDVEVVRRVVPAFFSPDGRYVVYEVGREIRVRDLATGADRLVDSGIAPRVLPFTMDFVFLRKVREVQGEGGKVDEGPPTTIQYDVVRGSFEGDRLEVLGGLLAEVRTSVAGSYSPVRWMRVRERRDAFYLEGPGVTAFMLPDPFGRGHAVAPEAGDGKDPGGAGE
ncbi:MAG TPA: hypothetical protein VKZ58_07215 [Longimicrobiales bacterium]|nr:hypothetical protein [Longimicrobiales bacterium]